MKICVVTHTIPRFKGDPSAPFIHTLCKALADTGHKVTVLTPFNSKINKKWKRNYRLETYKYIIPESFHILGYSQTLRGDKSMSLLSYLVSPFLFFFGFAALLNLVRKEKPDIISSHWLLPNGFIAALASKITGTPFTITIPGSDVYMAGKNPLFKWMAGIAVKNACIVLSDSPHYLKQLNVLGYFPDKSEVIRYGVDVDKFQVRKNPKSAAKNILAVGRMVSKKGFKYLIKAMPEILKKAPHSKLVIVGDGEERKNLERLADELGIASKIEFPGMVSHDLLAEYYSDADVFVMPSIKDEKGNIDASPVSMMEAMSAGIPVVATGFAGGEDLVIDGKTGFSVKEKNSEEISDAVTTLLKIADKKDLRGDVRQIAVSNFSSQIIAGKYTNCFKNCILQ